MQTLLDRADLRKAILTSAFIEDWSITPDTRLCSKTKNPDGSYTYDDYTRCDYIFRRLPPEKRPAFLKLPPEESLNEDPRREPADWDVSFEPGEFVEYIRPLQETLDFYHRNVKDPRHIAFALAQLQQQFPDADLEVISYERRGPTQRDALVRVMFNPSADRATVHKAERENYEFAQSLPEADLQAEIARLSTENAKLSGKVEVLENIVATKLIAGSTTYNIDGHVGSIDNKGDIGNASGQTQGNQIGTPAPPPSNDRINGE